MENLIILLDEEKYESTATVANLPSNDAVMKSLSTYNPALVWEPDPTIPTLENLVNTMCIVVWADQGASYSWYLGYIKEYSRDGAFQVDHLTRALKTSDSKWKYPASPDIQLVYQEKMVKCDIMGQWDMTANSRKRLYTLENYKTLSFACKNHISEL